MTLITSADAPYYDFAGAGFTGLAAPSRGASENAVWRIRLPPHSVGGPRHQLTREEILIAVSGSAVARIGDAVHDFAAGDAIIIPGFTDFTLDNPGKSPFVAIAVLPVGGRAMLPDAAPFIPPWAQ